MDINIVIDILLTAAIIAVALLNAFKEMGKTISEKVPYLIAEAAKLDLLGSEKMQRVVNELYEKYVPDVFKAIMTKQKLEEIAQKIYDNMKLFAKNDGKENNDARNNKLF